MRSALMCVAIVVLSALPAAAQTEAANELPKAVEQCIRDNAPAVERAIDRLPDAVDFLVEDICARPIAEQIASQQQATMTRLREAMKKSCDARSLKLKKNTQSDEEGFDACAANNPGLDFAGASWTLYAPATKRAAPAALAAQILLDLRIQRMNATSTQGTH